MRMRLRNLKASFFMKNKLSSPYRIKNYVFKIDGLTFTIYHHSSYLVNVTGVKSFLQLKEAQELLEHKLKQKVNNVRIDNTFFSQKNCANIDLNQHLQSFSARKMCYQFLHYQLVAVICVPVFFEPLSTAENF